MSQGCPQCGGLAYRRISSTTVECAGCQARYILPPPPSPAAGILPPTLCPNCGANASMVALMTPDWRCACCGYTQEQGEDAKQHASTRPQVKQCATCRFWEGSLSSFQAACSHVENMGRPAF